MKQAQNKTRLIIHAIFVIAAIIMLVDFIAPGSIIEDEIVDVQTQRQNYYNAAQNYHYSYKVITKQHKFLVTDDFADAIKGEKKIQYSVSPIFQKVNWHKLPTDTNKSFYSLRIASGLVLPLLMIIAIFVVIRYKKKLGSVVLILQILMIGNLYLLLT